MSTVRSSERQGWIHTLRAQVLLGIVLTPVAFAVVAVPWGAVQLAGAPDPDRRTTGTVVDVDRPGRGTCVEVVEYTVDGRSYRTESNDPSSDTCLIGPGGDEVVHYESSDPSEAYAGDVSTADEGSWLLYGGGAALALALVLGVLPALDLLAFRRRRPS